MISVDECVFCGRRRYDERGIPRWNKTVCLKPNAITVTVCPECRENYSISQFFKRVRKVRSFAYRAGSLGGRVSGRKR